MSALLRAQVIDAFTRRFGAEPPLLARSPGRVNLIGDHTDYNDGFVLPMAIDRAAWIALRPRDDRCVVVHSLDFGEPVELDLEHLSRTHKGWATYVQGIAGALTGAGYTLRGWDGVLAGDVPREAGLASSAAVELATARAFAGAAGLPWDPVAMARLAQRAENEWVGVSCGIMDQLICALGATGQALLIDCRSLSTRRVPIPPGATVVVLDTATRRGLVDSAYNERRAQCEAACTVLGIRALRDIDVDTFDAIAMRLDPLMRRRARHVVTENARTQAAAEALARGDLRRVGFLMGESHVSLRDDFEVSRPELDLMVEVAQGHSACYGARMTGAGFGGCAVALVESTAADAFAREVARAYEVLAKLTPAVYVCSASAGATLEAV